MRKFISRPLLGATILLTGWVSGAWATDTLQLVNAGSGASMGGVYTSPYGISISSGGVLINGDALLICDDFTTNINIGDTWFADVTTLSSLQGETSPTTALKFDQSATADQQIFDYATAAVLAGELMSLPNIGTNLEDAAKAGALSYALWGIFDPALLNSPPSSGEGALTPDQLAAAINDLNLAKQVVQNNAAANGGVVNLSLLPQLTIYTPNGAPGYTGNNPQSVSQEFLQVSMPEPSSPAILAVDVLAVLGLMVVFRRRISSRIN